MSRGQQGIGISAAGMYGQLTTGKPIKIVSKISPRKPAHYFEIQINTKTNNPEILNGKGDGEDIPPGEKGDAYCEKKGIHWISEYPVPAADPVEGEQESVPTKGQPVSSGTRVTIELEGAYKRGKGSVDEYLEQTAIANPHVTIHYVDPEKNVKTYRRSTEELPPEPKEIKPHPYGVELGRLFNMIKAEANGSSLSQFLTSSFSRVQSCGRPQNLRDRQSQFARVDQENRSQRCRQTLSSDPGYQNRSTLHRLYQPDWRGTDSQGSVSRCTGRIFCCRDPSAGRLPW